MELSIRQNTWFIVCLICRAIIFSIYHPLHFKKFIHRRPSRTAIFYSKVIDQTHHEASTNTIKVFLITVDDELLNFLLGSTSDFISYQRQYLVWSIVRTNVEYASVGISLIALVIVVYMNEPPNSQKDL